MVTDYDFRLAKIPPSRKRLAGVGGSRHCADRARGNRRSYCAFSKAGRPLAGAVTGAFGLAMPQRRELRRDDPLVGNLAVQDARCRGRTGSCRRRTSGEIAAS